MVPQFLRLLALREKGLLSMRAIKVVIYQTRSDSLERMSLQQQPETEEREIKEKKKEGYV